MPDNLRKSILTPRIISLSVMFLFFICLVFCIFSPCRAFSFFHWFLSFAAAIRFFRLNVRASIEKNQQIKDVFVRFIT
ncbi:hypothetical protein BZG83_13230 [Salinivibrio sp. PR919]|nr:hypothetical protein BZG83_13230 [Salinivibrio sp. PR919]